MLDFTRTLEEDRPLIHPTCVVKNCTFGRYVELGDHCIVEETHVGDYTYLFGSNDVIYSHIGKFNSIGTGVRINPVQHPAKTRAAAHHFTYRCAHYGFGPDDQALLQWRRDNHHVTTGNDVWIGHNAVIMAGVTLGHGAVVGAGAVVTHDVAPYEIVGACPPDTSAGGTMRIPSPLSCASSGGTGAMKSCGSGCGTLTTWHPSAPSMTRVFVDLTPNRKRGSILW